MPIGGLIVTHRASVQVWVITYPFRRTRQSENMTASVAVILDHLRVCHLLARNSIDSSEFNVATFRDLYAEDGKFIYGIWNLFI